jgi:hypothetical protein
MTTRTPPPARPGCSGEQAGGRLAHDFLGPVAEDVLGPHEPADDPSLRVEQEEGVVLGLVEEEAEQ